MGSEVPHTERVQFCERSERMPCASIQDHRPLINRFSRLHQTFQCHISHWHSNFLGAKIKQATVPLRM